MTAAIWTAKHICHAQGLSRAYIQGVCRISV